ncbi:hypothetical protein ACF081_10710 [Streptomyces longwoodensis]|uniref:hypothetical protein n=1 Tax=Streptomyces longwoodensis TaxID=68231 RepID=UPI0036F546DD
MPAVDLSSALAKQQHADQAIKKLESLIRVFNEDPKTSAEIAASLDSETGYHVFRVRSVPDYQSHIERVSLALGDVVGALRSALDYLAWQYACAYANGIPENPRRIYFPICSARKGQQHKNPKYLSPATWVALHEYQPCRGLNGRSDSWSGPYIHQLELLVSLSNRDKHQSLIHVELTPSQFSTIPTHPLPEWIVETEKGFEFRPDLVTESNSRINDMDFSHAAKEVAVGAEVARIRSPLLKGVNEIAGAGYVTPRFALPGGDPVIPALQRLSQYVKMILLDFEYKYFT